MTRRYRLIGSPIGKSHQGVWAAEGIAFASLSNFRARTWFQVPLPRKNHRLPKTQRRLTCGWNRGLRRL